MPADGERLSEEELVRLSRWAETHEPAGFALGRMALLIAEVRASRAAKPVPVEGNPVTPPKRKEK